MSVFPSYAHAASAHAAGLAILTLACAAPPIHQTPRPPSRLATAPIDSATLRAVARALSDDAMEGRRTGTPGADRAAKFLAGECRRLGLLPVGGNDYFQPVPLEEARIDSAGSTVRIVGPAKDTTFVYWEEFIPDIGTAATLRGFTGPLAYVGRARDIVYVRSNLPDLRGHVALLRGEFGAYGEAADTLRGRGAIGVISVVDDAKRYRLFRQTRGRSRLFGPETLVQSSAIPPLPTMMAGPRMTVTLYEPITSVTHGAWNDAYLNGLAANLPPPQQLAGWRAEVTLRTESSWHTSHNVACLLPGLGEAADTAFALTAHYDHIGISVPDLAGDSIYNGFTDNATGVAMALAVAEALVKDATAGRGPHRSVLFLFFTGEEQGLLGSDWWVTHPRWPLERTAGVLNLDANTPAGKPTRWRVSGDDGQLLVRLVDGELRRRGWSTSLVPPAPGSDHFPFARRGVPAVYFVPADGPYEGIDDAASDSMRSSIWARYHRPGDDYSEQFPFAGLVQYAELTRDLLMLWDRALGRPQTAAGSVGAASKGADAPM